MCDIRVACKTMFLCAAEISIQNLSKATLCIRFNEMPDKGMQLSSTDPNTGLEIWGRGIMLCFYLENIQLCVMGLL